MKPEIRQAGAILIVLAVLLIVGCVLAAIVGCEPQPKAEPEPQPVESVVAEPVVSDFVTDAKVEPDDRQGNWGPSCGWAASCIVLQEHGLPKTAEAWRVYYSGPTYQGTIKDAARDCGLGFAGTENGDMDFLWWCSGTNRKASITWRVPKGWRWVGHRVAFYGFFNERAYFVDVNAPEVMLSTPIVNFQQRWRWSGGEACTLYAYASQPPEPCKWEKFRGKETVVSRPAAP